VERPERGQRREEDEDKIGRGREGGRRERERERERETVELHARDGSFIIAFSCVVCATVSCSLITMIHSRPRLPLSLHYVCHSVFVAMINLCTNPLLPEEGGHNAYESANIITGRWREYRQIHWEPQGIRSALRLLGDKFFFQ